MSWAYDRAAELGQHRDDWRILERNNITTMTEAVRLGVEAVSSEGLLAFLRRHRVSVQITDIEGALLVDTPEEEKSAYRMFLSSHRAPFWTESIGHESGHLYAWTVLGSKGSVFHDYFHFFEEIFAVEFGKLWVSRPVGRRQAREVIRLLLR